MKDAIRQFYFWMGNNGKAPGTARAYRHTLEDLPFQDKDLKDVTPVDLQIFLSSFPFKFEWEKSLPPILL